MFKVLQDNYGYKLNEILCMSFKDFQLLLEINTDKKNHPQKRDKQLTTIDQIAPFLFQ